MNMNIHSVKEVIQTKTEKSTTSNGRVFYTKRIIFFSEDGAFQITLFNDVKKELTIKKEVLKND